MRVGIGYAVLPFDPGRVLLLGGVKLTGAWGLRGRSDGDVVLHAVCDALLGAAALGDLGDHFPTDDPHWQVAPSAVLVAEVLVRLQAQGWAPGHVDVTIIAERPDLEASRGAMRGRLASLLGLQAGEVNIKRSQGAGLAAPGAAEGIAALAIASLGAEAP